MGVPRSREAREPASAFHLRVALGQWQLLVVRRKTLIRARYRSLNEMRIATIENPQSNEVAKAFVRVIKRDHGRVSLCPDAKIVIRLPIWTPQCNKVRPHKVLGNRTSRDVRRSSWKSGSCLVIWWAKYINRSKSKNGNVGQPSVSNGYLFLIKYAI